MKTNVIIVVAPSGAGKSTFLTKILQEFPVLQDTVTYTTRGMRTGESEGNPYHFVSKEEFESLKKQNLFVEWAKVHTNYYGTPRQEIDGIIGRGRAAIMDVDIQGARNLKKFYPQASSIFLLPPSIEELKNRILKRDSLVPDDLEVRLQNAASEMAQAGEFDYRVVNDDFDRAYGEFKKIIADLVKSG